MKRRELIAALGGAAAGHWRRTGSNLQCPYNAGKTSRALC
jgi:hypothetical protein